MIEMLRVDDRLLHGQVAFVWSKQLNIQGIVVANDKLIEDEIQMMAIRLAAPQGIKLMIKSVEDAARILSEPRAKSMRILVVVREPADAARFIKNIADPASIARVNIGNSGRIQNDGKKMLTQEVYVDSKDIVALQDILATGLPFDIQMVPTNSKVNVKDALAHFEKEG
ncbi:MAG: PTS sugar transporter subunit IIB [Faecalibacterium sp.]|jgi:PTS system mannose-specific IIB component|nr:PTS sugar transporter subunit IIB [Faecalibacterium sp.]